MRPRGRVVGNRTAKLVFQGVSVLENGGGYGVSSRPGDAADDEIDFVALTRTLWDYKWLLAVFIVICGGVAGYLAFTTPPVYRAEVTVTTVHERGMGGGSSLMSQLGGIAGVAGLSLPAGDDSSRNAQAVLQSRHLVEEFISRYQLQQEFSRHAHRPLTLWLVVRQFRENVLVIRDDARKGTTTITVDWTDPAVAARWANGFVALANELIRVRALNDSTRNIEYLNDQIAKTRVVEIQRVMYSLIESETKTLMLANGRAEYAFTVVDPAVAPEVRVSPKRTVIILIGVVLGLVIGSVIALTHHKLRRRLDVPRNAMAT